MLGEQVLRAVNNIIKTQESFLDDLEQAHDLQALPEADSAS